MARSIAAALLPLVLTPTAARAEDPAGLLSARAEPFAEAGMRLAEASGEDEASTGVAGGGTARASPRFSRQPFAAVGETYREPAFGADPAPMIALGAALGGSFLLDDWGERRMAEDCGSEDAGDIARWAQRIGHDAALVSVLGLYAFGDDYGEDTAAMATSAVFTATVGSQGLKATTGRARPGTRDAGEFGGPLDLERDSFPSGHTAVAFAVATVYGRRYPKYKWAFYTAAAGVGWARMQRERHFLSDVVGGAALGYYSGRKAVANEEGILTFRW